MAFKLLASKQRRQKRFTKSKNGKIEKTLMTIFKRSRQLLIKFNQIEHNSKQLMTLISHY